MLFSAYTVVLWSDGAVGPGPRPSMPRSRVSAVALLR